MPQSADSSQADSLEPMWNAFLDGLRELAPAMLDRLPAHLRDDPQTQHEVGRLMLGAIAARSLDALVGDGDHPMFLPSLNVVLNVFQPNADTVYKTAHITPGGAYRLRGHAGSLRIAKIGMMAPPSPDGAITASAFHDIKSLETDDAGMFDVLLSPSRPAGHTGDWWELDPRADTLLLRQVACDWSTERDPTVSIERVDVRPAMPRPPAADLARRLRALAPGVRRTAMLLIEHVEGLQQEGFVNKFKVWDVVSTHGGLFGQFYYECAYELRDDEALLIESDYPETCEYASLILTNQIFETTDWYNNHSSLNAAQWRLDTDGRLRVVVSAGDPGVPNWLDTAGYPTGVVQGRWTDCSSNPVPSARKVAVADVVSLLPADTPRVTEQERDGIIRDRRARLQQRPLW